MSRGLGRIERDILGVLCADDWNPSARVPLPERLPQYRETAVYRALVGLVEMGLVEADRQHLSKKDGQRSLMVIRATEEGARYAQWVAFRMMVDRARLVRRMAMEMQGIPMRLTTEDVLKINEQIEAAKPRGA
jgi:hypothetical protein